MFCLIEGACWLLRVTLLLIFIFVRLPDLRITLGGRILLLVGLYVVDKLGRPYTSSQ